MHWGLLEISIFVVYLAAIILIVFLVSRKNSKEIAPKASKEVEASNKESETSEIKEKTYEL